jgi:hypothetical protein
MNKLCQYCRLYVSQNANCHTSIKSILLILHKTQVYYIAIYLQHIIMTHKKF